MRIKSTNVKDRMEAADRINATVKSMEPKGQPITKPAKCIACDKPATRLLNIPCSHGGIPSCDVHASDMGMRETFEAYKASHSKNIDAFKQTNPGS